MELIRLSTAGSVDDGKSTLIGRLLFELGAVSSDIMESVSRASEKVGSTGPDLSLLVDGLIAEREQNITIDVAHMYFSGLNRRYIIADSPGHFEYTRNMITGASNADVFIILVDVKKGISDQTYRHLYIASMLRIQTVIVCINKMDLIGYNESVFAKVKSGIMDYFARLPYACRLIFIPTSALQGDNVVKNSTHTNWYTGQSLSEIIESLPVKNRKAPFRFRIQTVLNQGGGGKSLVFAGKLISGKVKVQDKIRILPTGSPAIIKEIRRGGQSLEEGKEGESLCLQLDSKVPAHRGDLIVKKGEEPLLRNEFEAELCWFDEEPGKHKGHYLLQFGASKIVAQLYLLWGQRNLNTLQLEAMNGFLKMNEISDVLVKTPVGIPLESCSINRSNGTFILIDESSNKTIAVGFVK